MRSVTSPSKVYMRKWCPGSHNAESEFAEDAGSAPADEGTLLHPFAINRKLRRDHLTPKQQKLLEMCDRGSDEFRAQLAAMFGFPLGEQPPTWHNERLAIYGPDREELFDGEADIVYAYQPDGVGIEDFKMGFSDVDKASENYQLACYAISWTDFLDVETAVVAINQPRVSDKLTIAKYEFASIERARREIAGIMHAALDRNAPRIAGDHCHFCRAKVDCEEYRRKFRNLAIVGDAKSVRTVDNEQLERLVEAVKFANMIEREVMSEMRRRIEDGEIQGWHLKPNGETKEVVDIVGAYKELQQFFAGVGGFTGEAFSACTSLSFTKLKTLFKDLTGFSEKRAGMILDDILNQFIERRPKQPTPARDK